MTKNKRNFSEMGKLGGVARGKSIRKKYLNNPNYCNNCKKIIKPQKNKNLSLTKKQKFCSHSCSASFNNKNRKREKNYSKCKICEKTTQSYTKTYCKICKINILENKRKKDVHRSSITSHARTILNNSKRKKECQNCKYNKHVEVCHIKPVSSFNENTLITQINDAANLVYLCPNCHWEYDHLNLVLEMGIEPI